VLIGQKDVSEKIKVVAANVVQSEVEKVANVAKAAKNEDKDSENKSMDEVGKRLLRAREYLKGKPDILAP